jgi:hypothetical protein
MKNAVSVAMARRGLALSLAMSLVFTPAFSQDSKPMTNQDVINSVRANIGESIILAAIRASKPGFNTSANEIIKLQQSGVSDGLISAVIAAASARTSNPRSAAIAPSRATQGRVAQNRADYSPEEVILIDGGQRQPMHYLTPQIRTAVRALGFGGVGQYAVLNGPSAALRLTSRQPEFLLAVPSNAQAESYYTLANFVVRKNGNREVIIGGGYMSYSSGIHRDRVVATKSTQAPDQSGAPSGYTIYRISVLAPLPAGEYAMVLYNSQVRVSGFFAGGLDSYFDFSVGGG